MSNRRFWTTRSLSSLSFNESSDEAKPVQADRRSYKKRSFSKRRKPKQRLNVVEVVAMGSRSVCSGCAGVVLAAHKAAIQGHVGCLRALFEESQQGKRCIISMDRNGATPLHLAARENRVEALKFLLDVAIYPVNARGVNKETPLHVAAVHGNIRALQLLVMYDPRDKKQVIGDCDAYGMTPLVLASLRNRVECVVWMLTTFGLVGLFVGNPSHCSAVHMAAAAGSLEVLKLLISHRKLTANYQDSKGCTPVYFAAQEGNLECLKYLVKEGSANPLAKAKDGMTSLHAAAQGGHTDVLQCLVDIVGQDELLCQTRDGATPVHYCAAKGHALTLSYIVETVGQARAMKADFHGCTPAHDAADGGHTECLAILVEAGASIFQDDNDGMSPYTLALAAQSVHPQCAEYVQSLWSQSWAESYRQLPFTPNGTALGFIMSDSWLVQNGSDSHSLRMSKDFSGNNTFTKQPINSSGDGDMYHQAAVAANIDGMSLRSGVSTGTGLYDVPTLTTLNQGLDNNCPTSRGPSRRSSANLHQLVGFNYGLPYSNQLPSESQPALQEQKGNKENSASNLHSIDDLYAKIIPKHQRASTNSENIQILLQQQDEELRTTSKDTIEMKSSTLPQPVKSPGRAQSSPHPIPEPPPLPLSPPAYQLRQSTKPAKQETKAVNQSVPVMDGSQRVVKKSSAPERWNGAHSEDQGERDETKRSILISASAGKASQLKRRERKVSIADNDDIMSELEQVFQRRRLNFHVEDDEDVVTDL